MVKFNPENKEKLTIGEIFNGARKAKTKEEAKQYLDDYAAYIQKLRDEGQGADAKLDAMKTAKHNIGYFAGYYDKEEFLRIQNLFEVNHPVFGTNYPTSEEAFDQGLKKEEGKFITKEINMKYSELVKYSKFENVPLSFINKKNPTENECLEIIGINPLAIMLIKKQTTNICLEAVKEDIRALQFVKEQTPEICFAAVKQDEYALEYVKNQTREICLAAVKENGLALKYVKEQTPEICLEAVKENGWALGFVDKSIFDSE
jgi:hypothetical protein